MTLREILTGTSNWLRVRRFEPAGRCEPVLDSDGLLTMALEPEGDFEDAGAVHGSHESLGAGPQARRSAFGNPGHPVTTLDRREPVEKLQEGFNQLVEQLQQINEHLSLQLSQHYELMGRVRQLPQLLESLPSAVENQKNLTTQLLGQLRTTAAKDQQFIEAVGQIPAETARQTDTLTLINHQLAAAADIDVQMAESFLKFKDTLDRLNRSTLSNTEGILQMSRTFATSDRYVKYVMTRLNQRFTWVLAGALSVCLAAIGALAGIIIYLAR
jgi:hypothetical protein